MVLKFGRLVPGRGHHVWKGCEAAPPAFLRAALLHLGFVLASSVVLQEGGKKGRWWRHSASSQVERVFWSPRSKLCVSGARRLPITALDTQLRGRQRLVSLYSNITSVPKCLQLPQHSWSCPSGSLKLLLVILSVSSITFLWLVLQVSWCRAYK